jgi:hypothetical protein
MSRASSIKAFRQAVELLRSIDPGFALYVGSDVLHLMKGPSHDDGGRPLKDNILASAGDLRIGGGDW